MSAVATRALSIVGAPFRLHGRVAATGLDCVGVVACATGLAVPTGYALRRCDPAAVIALIERAGLVAAGAARAGDVLLMRVGPAQLHLAVRTAAGFVHADAGLGRVVERPGLPEWEVLGSWRL